MSHLVRIIRPDGEVRVTEKAFSQLCEFLGDAETPRSFWLGNLSIDTPRGNIRLVPHPHDRQPITE